MSQELFIGAHTSIGLGFENALKSIKAMGGNSVQIFLKSPRGRQSKRISDYEANQTKNYLQQNNVFLVGHCSYLLNFAKNITNDPWPAESLIEDMQNIYKLGGVGVVLHIGKYLDMQKEEAFKNIKKAITFVFENTPQETKMLFENTAGQGTEIGFRFDELKEIYNLFSDEQKQRIGFCLDTCHSFAAGYDLKTKEGVLNWQQEFDNNIGWEKVVCIHFNDAKKELGSRVDRHQDIGFGFIGEEGLKEVAKIAKKSSIPLILETTTEHETYLQQIQKIKNWF